MKRLWLVCVLLSWINALHAASSVIMGTSDALRCFQESQLPGANDPEACNRALRDDKLTKRDLAATHSNRGIIYANMGRLEDALADHNMALQIMPDLGQALVNRGNVYYRMHRFEEALAEYRKAMELQDGPAYLPYYNAGLALSRLKRFKEASTYLEKALELAPGMPRIEKKLETIRSVLKEDH